jgi:hypothetical protein
MPINLIKETDACARCLADCAPTGSWSIEPLCTGCIHDLKASTIPPIGLTPDDMILILRIR